VATVARELNLVILNYILLQDCSPVFALEARLLKCLAVEIALGDKSVVARNVGGCLGSSH
jgi:hypothetical protein